MHKRSNSYAEKKIIPFDEEEKSKVIYYFTGSTEDTDFNDFTDVENVFNNITLKRFYKILQLARRG